MDFWIKIGFFKKKNYKISFSLKVLLKVVILGHIGCTARHLLKQFFATNTTLEFVAMGLVRLRCCWKVF